MSPNRSDFATCRFCDAVIVMMPRPGLLGTRKFQAVSYSVDMDGGILSWLDNGNCNARQLTDSYGKRHKP